MFLIPHIFIAQQNVLTVHTFAVGQYSLNQLILILSLILSAGSCLLFSIL